MYFVQIILLIKTLHTYFSNPDGLVNETITKCGNPKSYKNETRQK